MSKLKIYGFCTGMLAMLLFVGCGAAKVPEIVDVTSLAISEEGAVTSYLVELFDKEYYSLSELTAMAVEEAAEYNTENQVGETVPLTVEKVEELTDGSGKVVVTHKYDSTNTFEDFNESVLFYGTVTEAINAGYKLDVVLKSVKDGTSYTEAQLLQSPDKYLLITDEQAIIYCPKKVAFVSENAVYKEDGSIDTTQAQGTVVILMK
uniref:hypothetical protein n=1 Tax=Acetatifactor sp. TaxID=1872090 RepID=UPI0040571ED0